MTNTDTRKWYDIDPRNQTWEEYRHPWFWYISQHWQYTGLSDQALTTWLSLYRFATGARSTVNGHPRTFFRGLSDPTGARSRKHRRSVAELTEAGLVEVRGRYTYSLLGAKEFALSLRQKISEMEVQNIVDNMMEEEDCDA
jgi:hypothetical protein